VKDIDDEKDGDMSSSVTVKFRVIFVKSARVLMMAYTKHGTGTCTESRRDASMYM
jgi:hypothetical protein